MSNEYLKTRTELGLSQAEIASKVGVSQGTFCRWEKGQAAPRGLSALAWNTFVAANSSTNAM